MDVLCSPRVGTFPGRIPDKTPLRHIGIEDLDLTLRASIYAIVKFYEKTGVVPSLCTFLRNCKAT